MPPRREANEKKPLHVLIIDDHAAIRRGLQTMLEDEFEDVEVSGAGDAPSAVEQLRARSFEIVLCDINLPGRNGIEALKEIKFAQPNTPVLMLSMHPEEQFAIRALKAGASGYLTKSCEPEELVTAVKTLLAGRKYINASVAEQLASSVLQPGERAPHERFSDREHEVFLLLASGKAVKEAAAELNLSVKTISTHREHILRKMGMRTNADLTLYAVKNGLVQ
jgi:two-component system, NarL family, invasion response regulator UvrY